MAEATVLEVVDVGMPDREIVRLECSNGETYRSRKFKTVESVEIGNNASSVTDEVFNWTASGQEITIEILGSATTDVVISLEIMGDK